MIDMNKSRYRNNGKTMLELKNEKHNGICLEF